MLCQIEWESRVYSLTCIQDLTFRFVYMYFLSYSVKVFHHSWFVGRALSTDKWIKKKWLTCMTTDVAKSCEFVYLSFSDLMLCLRISHHFWFNRKMWRGFISILRFTDGASRREYSYVEMLNTCINLCS